MSNLFIRDYLRDQLRSTDVAGRNESSGDIFSRVLVQRVLTPSGWQERIVAQAGPNGGLVDGDGNVFLQSGSIEAGIGIDVDQQNGSPSIGIRTPEVLTGPVIETVTRYSNLQLDQPYDVIPVPAGIWVINASSRYQRLIDTSTMAVIATADLGSGKNAYSAYYDGTDLWIVDKTDGLHRANPATGVILNTYTLTTDTDSPSTSGGAAQGTRHIIGDGLYLIVVNHDEGEIDWYLKSDGSLVDTLAVGDMPYGLLIRGRTLYVSVQDDNAIAVVDLDSRTLTTTWTPSGLAKPRGMATDGKLLAVAISQAGSSTIVRIYNIETGELRASLTPPDGYQCYDVYFDGVNFRAVNYAYYGGDSRNACRLYSFNSNGTIIAGRDLGFAHQRGMASVSGILYVAMAGNQSELVTLKPSQNDAWFDAMADNREWPQGTLRDHSYAWRFAREVNISAPVVNVWNVGTTADAALDGWVVFGNSSIVSNSSSSYRLLLDAPDTTGRGCGIVSGRKSNGAGSFGSGEDFLVTGKMEARTHSNLAGVRHYVGFGSYTIGTSASAVSDPATATDPRLSITSGSNFVQINIGDGWINTSLSVSGLAWWWEFSRVRGVMITKVSLDAVNWVVVNTQTGITSENGRIVLVASICENDTLYTSSSNNRLELLRLIMARNPRN